MADNVAITAGTGTTIAADDIGAGILAQRVKPVWGPDGTGNDTDVAAGKPLPVQLRAATGQTLADTTGLLISTTQVAPLATTSQAMSAGYQSVALPSDQVAVATKAAINTFVDGANVTLGAKADAKSTATDTTPITAMSVLKQISASVQAPPSQAVTNAGAFAVQSSAETSTIYNSTTALTPKFQKVIASSSGATTIVAAVTSKKIRVLSWDVVANAAVNFKWQSHVTPTDLTGLYYMAGQGNGVARGFSQVGYFETVSGEALDINLSGAVAVGGVLTYVEV